MRLFRQEVRSKKVAGRRGRPASEDARSNGLSRAEIQLPEVLVSLWRRYFETSGLQKRRESWSAQHVRASNNLLRAAPTFRRTGRARTSMSEPEIASARPGPQQIACCSCRPLSGAAAAAGLAWRRPERVVAALQPWRQFAPRWLSAGDNFTARPGTAARVGFPGSLRLGHRWGPRLVLALTGSYRPPRGAAGRWVGLPIRESFATAITRP